MRLNTLLFEKKVSAADWEFLISYAWNKLKYPDYKHMKLSGLAGIKTSSAHQPAWIRDNLEVATKIAKNISSKINNNAPMTQIGGGVSNISVSSDWLSSNKTPKTDIILGTLSSPIMKISLKQDGGSQLMSGTENDILSVTEYALKNTHDLENELLLEIKTLLEKSSTTIPDTISNIKKSGQKSVAQDDIKQMALSQEKLNEIFSSSILKSNDFKSHFTKEAMTGLKKFGQNSIGAADHLMKFNKNGSADIMVIDKSYVDKISNQVKFNFSFKSMPTNNSNYKAYTSLRVQDNSKTLESKTITYLDVLEESLNLFLNDGTILEEGIGDLFKKIKSFVDNVIVKLFDTIKEIVKGGLKNLLDFLGMNLDVQILGNVNY